MHYVYNKEGVMAFFGLSDAYQIKRYKNKAIKAGALPSKIIGGTELFDISVLLNPKKYKQNIKQSSSTRTRIQLTLF